MKKHRIILLFTASLLYVTFAIVMHPYVGISVMLPSILLCGLTTWLFGWKGGLITLFLSHPSHVLIMMYNLQSFEGWRTALEPRGLIGGIAAQLCAVMSVYIIKNNHNMIQEITADLEIHINRRNEELKRITEYMMVRSETERSLISEIIFGIVTKQLFDLKIRSLRLKNDLTPGGASQYESATKLVQLAELNIQHISTLRSGLISQNLVEQGIETAFHKLRMNLSKTTNTDFEIIVHDPKNKLSEETSLNIYRISHEAVTNALRHGKATHISISLDVVGDICTLKIMNNGNPLASVPNEGLGMRLIQQRAEMINAEISLESTRDGKTLFKCIVPLQEKTSLFGHET